MVPPYYYSFFNHQNFGFVKTVSKQCPALERELGSWKEPMAEVGGSQKGLAVCVTVAVSILKWDRCLGKDWKAIHQRAEVQACCCLYANGT